MVIFGVMYKFKNRDFNGLEEFMRDEEGSGFFVLEGVDDGAEYIHLMDGIVIAEDAVKVSVFYTISEVKEKR